jgi:hypothetical protein
MWYNHYFLRQDKANAAVEKVNPVPYLVYFETNQQQPNTFFTAPAFPEYSKRCHDQQKFCSIMPMQQLYADLQWLWSIQFVGSQGGRNELVGLTKLINNLTNLAPYWDYPYAFGGLMIPMQKSTDNNKEKIALEKESWINAYNLSQKWEMYTCDPRKIAGIEALDETWFIHTVYDTELKQPYTNPCPSYERAHYAAFNAFYYRWDAVDSARNYKISAFTDWSPGLTPLMAALVYGRGWEHMKWASLWYERYTSITTAGGESDVLQKEADRALKKSVFELQLQLITEADAASEECNKSYQCLVDKGYILQTITNSYQSCKSNPKDIRCVLLAIWLQQKRISLSGKLIYPVDTEFMFSWSEDYSSRWIQPK